MHLLASLACIDHPPHLREVAEQNNDGNMTALAWQLLADLLEDDAWRQKAQMLLVVRRL